MTWNVKPIKVREMPSRLQSALLERGFNSDAMLSPRKAISEYSAWHLGDRLWGEDIADFLQEMNTNQ